MTLETILLAGSCNVIGFAVGYLFGTLSNKINSKEENQNEPELKTHSSLCTCQGLEVGRGALDAHRSPSPVNGQRHSGATAHDHDDNCIYQSTQTPRNREELICAMQRDFGSLTKASSWLGVSDAKLRAALNGEEWNIRIENLLMMRYHLPPHFFDYFIR